MWLRFDFSITFLEELRVSSRDVSGSNLSLASDTASLVREADSVLAFRLRASDDGLSRVKEAVVDFRIRSFLSFLFASLNFFFSSRESCESSACSLLFFFVSEEWFVLEAIGFLFGRG